MPLGTRIIDTKDGTRTLVFERCTLFVIDGPDRKRELSLDKTAVRVGTAPSNDLVLTDTAVSAEHFEVHQTEEGVLVRDLDSTNGTFVGDLRIGEVYLTSNADIRAGESRLRLETQHEKVEIPLSSRTNFGALLGHSLPMRAVFAILERVAPTNTTVLIEGESGTGKELAAKALHDLSDRAGGPYVVLDCGAVPAELFESELFGHLRGAFTNATSDHTGVFERAAGGTLVLDEIGDLPLDIQPKLLRAVETKSVQPLGATQRSSFDVRLIASTNRNLEAEVEAGRFRQDLFSRLSVIRVTLPPLRDRRDEIPRLVSHFIDELGGDPSVEPQPALLNALRAHDWPGNVRELRNTVERVLVLPGLDVLEYVQPAAGADPSTELSFSEARKQSLTRFEKEYMMRLLSDHSRVTEAAQVAGLSRQSCYRLMRKHGLSE